MSHYRRSHTKGASYFFTVVTYQRRRFLCDDDVRVALRESIERVRANRQFSIDAWVLLPDHMHCIWTLPDDDGDFSSRWSAIKKGVTRRVNARLHRDELLTPSKVAHRESTIWQRRFWEHQIRNDRDFEAHMDYIHFNPVKHGLVNAPIDWPYSSIHRLVREAVYPERWAGSNETNLTPYDVE
jgi:putative transposase